MTIKHSFAPVVDDRTRVLILGSLPSEVSLAERRYYANPSNQFWRLTGAVVGQNLAAMEYDARLSALRDAGIGLWDSIGSAKRSGSLDTAIRDHTPNALRELVASVPALQVVGFNGGTSARIGRRQLGEVDRNLIDLPSSSAAYCAISFEAKRARWMKLRPFLDIRAGRLQR